MAWLVVAAAFPGDDALCESCGYILRGLSAEGHCPECGRPIVESDPVRRVGLPWQVRPGVVSWLATTWRMIGRPRCAYRSLRVDDPRLLPRPNLRDFAYLATFCAFTGIVWAGLFWYAAHRSNPNETPHPANIAFGAIIVSSLSITALTMIEAAGVTWVSQRRGWRVPFSLAFSVACYAAIGWLPAAIVTALGSLWYSYAMEALMWNPLPGYFDYIAALCVFMVSILWFESLVWLGVRQVRFANRAGS